jgi:putative transposase
MKYECIYLNEFNDGIKARVGIAYWMKFYNEERPHSLFYDDRTPMEEYHRLQVA